MRTGSRAWMALEVVPLRREKADAVREQGRVWWDSGVMCVSDNCAILRGGLEMCAVLET